MGRWGTERAMSGYNFSRLRVLIVDDQQPVRIIMRAGLEAFGFTEIYEADNGEDGLDMALRRTPDIVFIDWIMEPMDGLTFTRIVRSGRRGLNPAMAIVLVTGRTDRTHVIEARDAGVTEIVAKPISFDHLYRRIISMIEHPRELVKSKTYIGPDRRRTDISDPDTPKRRNSDRKQSRL